LTTTTQDAQGHFGRADADGGGDGRHMGHLDEGHTHGPTDSQYFTIFWVLFGITALEVTTYWWEDWFGQGGWKVAPDDTVRAFGMVLLLILMVIKFALIVGFFMHLRFDSALLRRTFSFGLALGLAVYLITLTSMNFWTYNGNPWFNDPSPPITTTTVVEGG
jgi:cytochrome c oxidase subunit 4